MPKFTRLHVKIVFDGRYPERTQFYATCQDWLVVREAIEGWCQNSDRSSYNESEAKKRRQCLIELMRDREGNFYVSSNTKSAELTRSILLSLVDENNNFEVKHFKSWNADP